MILICDKDISKRAVELQKLLHSLGCPTAISPISDIKSSLPARLFITFCDTFDELRRTPYDSIFAVVIGDGFVNTALNATRAQSVDDALDIARHHLIRLSGLSQSAFYPFGVLTGGIFIGKYFIELDSKIITPTDTEYLIFKYIYSCSTESDCVDADVIGKYCSRAATLNSNAVAAHISNLNRKSMDTCGKRIIFSKRHKGYYIKIR